jgi:polysaccharide deacetylase 2 family uncharacterized protein YibQ
MKALAVATGIVFWTLVLGIAWLAFFPGSDSGGPVAILQIEPATAPSASEPADGSESMPAPEESEAPAQAPAEAPSQNGMNVPPGFAVGPEGAPTAPMVAPPGSGQGSTLLPTAPGVGTQAAPPPDDATPPDDADPDQQGSLPAEQSGMQQTALAAPEAAPARTAPPPTLPVPESETGSITLPEVPVAELVEESQYGPLPKIANDGRRPAEMYARPSRYAAAPAAGEPSRIAVLLTGLGTGEGASPSLLKGLPPTVSVAFGAYGRSLQDAVTSARDEGHEVLLQIPLEPNNYPTEDPGPHTLLTTLPPAENLKRLQWLMSRYTGYVGVTNLMGAKFDTSAPSLQPVLEEMKRRGLLYVDDGATAESPATKIAETIGLDYSTVSVQIDAGDVAKQLAKLEAAAKERGAAIGVAKAKPATVKQLIEWASKLEGKGVVLVPVSAALRAERQS